MQSELHDVAIAVGGGRGDSEEKAEVDDTPKTGLGSARFAGGPGDNSGTRPLTILWQAGFAVVSTAHWWVIAQLPQ